MNGAYATENVAERYKVAVLALKRVKTKLQRNSERLRKSQVKRVSITYENDTTFRCSMHSLYVYVLRYCSVFSCVRYDNNRPISQKKIVSHHIDLFKYCLIRLNFWPSQTKCLIVDNTLYVSHLLSTEMINSNLPGLCCTSIQIEKCLYCAMALRFSIF